MSTPAALRTAAWSAFAVLHGLAGGCAGGGEPSGQRVGARALATLAPLPQAPARDGGVDPSELTGAVIRHTVATEPVAGEATFTATREGVDLHVTTTGCIYTRGYPLRIVDEDDCANVSADSPAWDGERGAAPANAACNGTSMRGRGYASRPSTGRRGWTIGPPASSDVVGKLLVLSDTYSGQPLACGAIESAPDLPAAPAGDAGAAPVELQAAVAGYCFLRQADAPAECDDPAPLVECATTHCRLASCVAACPLYVACLAEAPDACSATASCAPETACATCMSTLTECLFGYCFDQLACAPPATPGGPCDTLRTCCESQGEFREPCHGLVTQLERLGGERTCVGTIADWDWNQALPVPCEYAVSSP